MARPRLRAPLEGDDAAAADVVDGRLHEQVSFYRDAASIEEPLKRHRRGWIAGPAAEAAAVVFVAGLEVGILPRRDAEHLLETGFKPGDPLDPGPLEEA